MFPCYDYNTDNHPLSPIPRTWAGHGVRAVRNRENTAGWWGLWQQRGAWPGRKFGALCRELHGWGSGARHARWWQDKEGGDTVFRCLLRIRTVSAVGSGAGLFTGSWGVFATTDLCWEQSPFPVHTQGWVGPSKVSLQLYLCALKAALKESPVHSWKHMQLLLLLIIEGGNFGNVYGRKPVDFSRYSSLAKTCFSNQCKYSCKRGESSDQAQGNRGVCGSSY